MSDDATTAMRELAAALRANTEELRRAREKRQQTRRVRAHKRASVAGAVPVSDIAAAMARRAIRKVAT